MTPILLPPSAELTSIPDAAGAATSLLCGRSTTGQEAVHLSDKHRQHSATALGVLESTERVSGG